MSDHSELRASLAKLGLSQTGMAQLMKGLDDDREVSNILRSIQRMIAGDIRFSGEMRALVRLLELLALDGRTLDLLRSGKMRSHADDGTGQVDDTAAETQRLEARCADLQSAAHGLAKRIEQA